MKRERVTKAQSDHVTRTSPLGCGEEYTAAPEDVSGLLSLEGEVWGVSRVPFQVFDLRVKFQPLSRSSRDVGASATSPRTHK